MRSRRRPRPRSADAASLYLNCSIGGASDPLCKYAKPCYFATFLFGRGSARIRQARLVAPVSFDREWPIETGTTSLACLAFLPHPTPNPQPPTGDAAPEQDWHPGPLVAAPQELHSFLKVGIRGNLFAPTCVTNPLS